MAVEYVVPYAVARELVTYKQAEEMLADTPYPVSGRTLQRWARQEQLPVERIRGVVYVSFSDLLMVHLDRALGREQ
ncbi:MULTISPECIES: hypothetical protein [Streptomyces]|uniref:Uncharacterized protein n=1 Tax=Streptomyces fradiae ATCC 10745 = DSM 40063 TaxID=1319510 RepID=A0A1Y2P2B3_STRFR|nr:MULTISPECIES: hypothetical protein [Streptomyces]KAF0646584.1 hypothetical protein K701_27940 [Streptomyces fradiae ATCC 10745 = DSM 40063]OSY53936.1 hypothetical protein BG846_00396 [Streptomyces fradiae ATCC 10745 = DSM 40063]